MKKLLPYLLLCAVVLPYAARAQSAEDEAGDVSEVDKDRVGPLRDRVRPVSGHLFLKQGRFELSPGLGLSFRDAFFTKYTLGLSLTYHPVETVGISLHGALTPVSVVSGAAQICQTSVATTSTGAQTTRGCRSPDYSEVNGRAPGQITMLGGLDLQWAPIYGKVAVFAESFAHFDMYGLVGPTFVMYDGPGTSPGSSVAMSTVGGNVGLGMRFILNRFIAVRTELRDVVYNETVEGGSSLRQQLFFEAGLSFFLPTSIQEG